MKQTRHKNYHILQWEKGGIDMKQKKNDPITIRCGIVSHPCDFLRTNKEFGYPLPQFILSGYGEKTL